MLRLGVYVDPIVSALYQEVLEMGAVFYISLTPKTDEDNSVKVGVEVNFDDYLNNNGNSVDTEAIVDDAKNRLKENSEAISRFVLAHCKAKVSLNEFRFY